MESCAKCWHLGKSTIKNKDIFLEKADSPVLVYIREKKKSGEKAIIIFSLYHSYFLNASAVLWFLYQPFHI